MKKAMILLAVTCLLCGLALAGGKGAVKTDMVIHTDSAAYGTPGTVVGSVNLNTTANGTLIVVVNLDEAIPLEDDPDTEAIEDTLYDSLVWIDGVKIADQVAVDCLKVNAKGQGTANYKVDLATVSIPDDATEILVRVIVRPSFGPNTTPCYVGAWPAGVAVPLK